VDGAPGGTPRMARVSGDQYETSVPRSQVIAPTACPGRAGLDARGSPVAVMGATLGIPEPGYLLSGAGFARVQSPERRSSTC